MDPGSIEAEITTLSEKLEEETVNLGDLSVDAANAEADAKLAFAQAYLNAEGKNADERESRVLTSKETVHEEGCDRSTTCGCPAMIVSLWQRKRYIAEALRNSKQEQLRSIRSQLDALRTLAANVRTIV